MHKVLTPGKGQSFKIIFWSLDTGSPVPFGSDIIIYNVHRMLHTFLKEIIQVEWEKKNCVFKMTF